MIKMCCPKAISLPSDCELSLVLMPSQWEVGTPPATDVSFPDGCAAEREDVESVSAYVT